MIGQGYRHELDTVAPSTSHYCVGSGSRCHHWCKMAAPVSGMFWLRFCSTGGSGDASVGFIVLSEGCANLYEDGDHSDAMRALSCLSVVGVQILVIMDQLDLKERHNCTDHFKPHLSNEQIMFANFTFLSSTLLIQHSPFTLCFYGAIFM